MAIAPQKVIALFKGVGTNTLWTDQSGNGKDGVISGLTSPVFKKSFKGDCITFPVSASGSVKISGTGSYSISTFIKFEQGATQQYGGIFENSKITAVVSTIGEVWVLFDDNTTKKRSTKRLPVGVWVHLFIDQLSRKIYFNGEDVTSDLSQNWSLTAWADSYIGKGYYPINPMSISYFKIVKGDISYSTSEINDEVIEAKKTIPGIKSTFNEMEIGDAILLKYDATNGEFGTFSSSNFDSNLPNLPSTTPNGSFYAYMVDTNHKGDKVVVADRNIQAGISWDTLNKIGASNGVAVSIGECVYDPMTSDTTPAPYRVTADSFYLTNYGWKAFDKGVGYWYDTTSFPDENGHWLKIDLGVAKRVNKITLESVIVSGANHSLKNWKLYGSNDDSDFTFLTSGTHPNGLQIVGYDFVNETKYRYYRVNVLDSYHSAPNYVGIREVGLYNNDSDYKITARLLTGGTSSTDRDNEWDRYIASGVYGDDTVWNNLNYASMTSTTDSSNAAARVIRGLNGISNWTSGSTNLITPNRAFRPVLILEHNPTPKILFKDSEGVKSFNGTSWDIISSQNVTVSDFQTFGMSPAKTSTINKEAINLLKSPFEILKWIDSMKAEPGNAIVHIPTYNALSSLTSEKPELLLWTEEQVQPPTASAIPVMTSNTTPNGTASATSTLQAGRYEPWNAFMPTISIEGSWYSSRLPTVEQPEMIMYEFPKSIVINKIKVYSQPSINMTANPKDFEFVAWDGNDWVVLNIMTGVTDWVANTSKEYKIQNEKPYKKYGLRITSNNGYTAYVGVSYIEMFEMPSLTKQVEITGNPSVRFRYKVDYNGETLLKDWSAYDIKPVNDTVTIPSSYISALTPSKINVTAENYFDGLETSNYGSIILYDTEPALVASMKGQTLHLEIGDEELDRVRFNIKVNGKQVYPIGEGFSPLEQSPFSFVYRIDSSEIMFGSLNRVEIVAEDEFGKQSNLVINFLGDYSGIMFVDEQGEYFSDNLGKVLQYLDFGSIIAGRITLPKKVRIVNKNGYPINNLLLTLDGSSIQSSSLIQLSKTESPFTPEQNLVFDQVLEHDEEVPVYVRIVTDKDASPHDGTFDIIVNADPL